MVEKGFVESIQRQIKKKYPGAVVIKPADGFSLGIPDLLAWIPINTDGFSPWTLAIEAKQLRPLMDDPFHKGRRTGMMLKHHFSGPQISMLRKMKSAGVDAFGLVRASCNTAFRIEPEDIPAKTGNFTHEELMKFGVPVYRIKGVWGIRKRHD